MPSLLATSGMETPAASSASSSRSMQTICSGACLFFNFESPPLDHLGPSDSHSSWISFRGAGQGLAPRTVHYHHTLLNQAPKMAVEWGYVRRNVAAVVDPPKVEKKEMNPLSAAQVIALLEAAKGDRLEASYLLAVSTGMRLGELQALKWADIDLRERTLSVNRTLSATKGGPVFGPPK